MKKILLLLVLLISTATFSQEKEVDIFDKNRKIIKLRVKEKNIEKVLWKHKVDTIYIQKKVNGKWQECKYIQRKDNFKFIV